MWCSSGDKVQYGGSGQTGLEEKDDGEEEHGGFAENSFGVGIRVKMGG